jgi:REP element-mobilizing transposase RayT
MRPPRYKQKSTHNVFHCMSRTVAGEYLFKAPDKEFFTLRLRKLAKFLQIKVLTHTILDNHFHLLIRTPAQVKLSDHQLRNLLKGFYGDKSLPYGQFCTAMKSGNNLEYLRQRYLKRMGDLSVFMKELKEGFSKFYNETHARFGTLWAERFKSVTVEDHSLLIHFMAAYIDLNAFRAGMTRDPKDYRFCGYAEALARDGPAREGLESFLIGKSWKEKIASYRKYLYGTAEKPSRANQQTMSIEEVEQVLAQDGHVPPFELLKFKIKYFTQGIALGTEGFLRKLRKELAGGQKKEAGKKKGKKSKTLHPLPKTFGSGIHTLKKIKKPWAKP